MACQFCTMPSGKHEAECPYDNVNKGDQLPKSHDGKPRNKHRREKFQKDMAKRAKGMSPLSFRQLARRQLRQSYLEIAKAQRELEVALRQVGITWRNFEKAVHKNSGGDWKQATNALVQQLLKREGIAIAKAA